MIIPNSKYPSFYIKNIEISGLKCFKEKTNFKFTGPDGNPRKWTIILGNNNTGKTTILKALAGLEAKVSGGNNHRVIYDAKTINLELRDITAPECEIEAQIVGSVESRSWMYRKRGLNSSVGWISSVSYSDIDKYNNFQIYGYGVGRRSENKPIEGLSKQDNSASLFNNRESLLNIKEWLLQLDYAIKNNAPLAPERMLSVKEALFNGLLPDMTDFRVYTDENFNSVIEFQTNSGWRTLDEIGYGYQSSLAWIGDFMKKMFDRYPDSDKPLAEPAILLIDEIDLHLHPSWQRKVLSFLSKAFSNTQFIVTTHNPLIVQSAEDISLIVLKREGDKIKVENPEIPSFKGWTVEEILSEFMELDGKVMSEDYIKILSDFDNALDLNDYEVASNAYIKLEKMLHPSSPQRKLLRIQMNQIKQ